MTRAYREVDELDMPESPEERDTLPAPPPESMETLPAPPMSTKGPNDEQK